MQILHFEDSANDAALTEALLLSEWPDCRIAKVDSRADYLRALELGAFDLIISDYAMPDFDGLAALEIARTACPDKPFIFMSGTLGEERAIEALHRGATDYVVKDRPGRLVPAIRLALARVEEKRDRHRIEEALRQNQQRFQAITENVADMISVIDAEGRSLYRNPAYRDLFGDAGDQLGDAPFSRIHPEDRERVRAVLNRIILTGAKHRLEYRYQLPDGAVHHIEAAGSVIRDTGGKVLNVLVVSRDITERKRSEEQVRELAALLEKTQDAIYVRDLDQHITYWNSGAERLYGWKADEILGRRAVELLYKAETPELLEIRRTVMTKGEWSGELRQLTRSGREVVVLARRTLLRDSEGRPVSILNLNTDVTEQRQLQAQLLRNQRLESIGTLTGGIAHDLNNVLSPIMIGASLLSHWVIDARARSTLEAMTTSARHGAALVRQLLTFARGTEGERSLVQPGVLLADFAGLLHQSLPRSVHLAISTAPDCWPVLGDVTQLQQVLLNLSLNARDAMPQGGKLAITTCNVVVDEAFARRLPAGAPGAHLRISVSDTGSGMSAEIIEKIFDPFFTTKAPGKGTGLGLSTVRGIIKGHGGFIDIDSEVGRGSTFHLYFPMFRPVSPPAAPTGHLPVGRGETILVVDDDPGMRDLMQSLLDMKGYQTLLACDGVDALKVFTENPDRIAAVVTDMFMPVMNGASLIVAIRAIRPALPVIAVTGLGDLGKSMPGFDQRTLSALILKPIDAVLLLGELRRALDQVA
jgi:PAS domain S-box-containing protein